MDALQARIEAVLRRRPPARAFARQSELPRDELRVGDLVIEPHRGSARLAGALLALTPTEFRLLTTLMAHAESMLTRERLAHDRGGARGGLSNHNSRTLHQRGLKSTHPLELAVC
jgi:DNA-binding response OmpR family regulator